MEQSELDDFKRIIELVFEKTAGNEATVQTLTQLYYTLYKVTRLFYVQGLMDAAACADIIDLLCSLLRKYTGDTDGKSVQKH